MKILALLVAFLIGAISGFSLGAWALYEPIPLGPAKYALSRSSGPILPYAIDGSQKLFRIECISEAEKDCSQATPIPEPGSAGLMGIGLLILGLRRKHVVRKSAATRGESRRLAH